MSAVNLTNTTWALAHRAMPLPSYRQMGSAALRSMSSMVAKRDGYVSPTLLLMFEHVNDRSKSDIQIDIRHEVSVMHDDGIGKAQVIGSVQDV